MRFLARVNFDAHYGSVLTAADGATVSFDCSLSDKFTVTLGGNRTLAVSNDQDGQAFTVVLKQDVTGSRTVTWWSGIKWPGGTVPTLTTTGGKADVFTFIRNGAGDYYGFTAGLNM